ncbi:MAG: pyrroline-5-carboxylate reductase [Desulfurivibrionaceae bacterium]|nr:pyrroline-5-carboxylate reductase [Desulfurivibrionaceae bacterium]
MAVHRVREKIMKIKGTIGFFGGGRMAEALIKGIMQAGLFGAEQIVALDPDKERRRLLAGRYRINAVDNPAALADCEIVVLAVKPQILPNLLRLNRSNFSNKQLVISIAAGVSLEVLESCLAGCDCRVIRVMPNTPALVMEGASALCPGSLAAEEDLKAAAAIFDAVGKSVVLGEAQMDAVTGLSGSGPAYVFSFIEALIDGGVKVGLGRDVAETLALQTVLGAVKLAIDTGGHPAELRAMVTSPGGTTIAGLHQMEKAGFQGIVMDAIEAATRRSRELGELAAQRVDT